MDWNLRGSAGRLSIYQNVVIQSECTLLVDRNGEINNENGHNKNSTGRTNYQRDIQNKSIKVEVNMKVELIEVHSRRPNKFAPLGKSYQRNNSSTGEEIEMKRSSLTQNKNKAMVMNIIYNTLLLYQLVNSFVTWRLHSNYVYWIEMRVGHNG